MAIDRTERLLNLVFCLMSAQRPVSRAEIQRTIPGYGSEQSAAAFERMFERDKDELRSMGIPIETVVDVNGEVEGYRISPDEYALPPLQFDAQEAAVLALAARVWDDAVLQVDAVTALRKLEAASGLGTTTIDADHRPFSADRTFVRHSASDAHLRDLMAAVRASRVVTFPYETASGAAGVRTVDPWGVIARGGSWYLVGRDHDRDATRAFRLSRITGPVTIARANALSQRPDDFDLAQAITVDHGPGISARVAVRAGGGAELRRLASSASDPMLDAIITLDGLSERQLVDAVCAAGAGAELLEPVNARDAVIARLQAVAQVHR
jgi:proteasome accessory factor B